MRILPTLVMFFAVSWTVVAVGQTLERGDINGTVYDPNHAVLPNAAVTLSSASTGFQRAVHSDNDGRFQFAQVPPGEYQLSAEAPGFARARLTVQSHVGGSIVLDVNLRVAGSTETVEVAATVTAVDTTTAGVSQLINSENVSNLPLSGRDYRDLAQLSPSAQVVPGLRGGIRLGGQQSDYSGLAIDGGDATNNFFGEFFGSLETKNFTVPLDAVQEFQVVTNGFAPEFGRSTGGLINVVTKSGTNEVHGSIHDFYRSKSLTADDALGVASNIDIQNQVGASLGFPIRKDRQFMFLAFDRQVEHGPLVTKFSRDVSTVPPLGPPYNFTLASLQGAHTQGQNLFSVLGHYDWQINNANHFSIRGFFSRNATVGFTGGRGQNEVSAAFDNTETFHNQGLNGVFSLNSVIGPNKVNEIKVLMAGETRPRHPNGNVPEAQINDTGIFGQRFFLPINNDNGKLQVQDNFDYIFGKHDIKFGGDVDSFDDRKDLFAGWSRGTYIFATLEDFEARNPFGFIQGFGLNGQDVFKANGQKPNWQTGIGLYWQDKWQLTPKITLIYGVRWDGTRNPQPQSGTPGSQVYVGEGAGSHLVAPPQKIPNDYEQWGPRVGVSYNVGPTNRPTLIHAAWGLYYAFTPGIFLPTLGNEKGATLFCFFNPSCIPPGGFPNLFPSTLQPNDPLFTAIGPPGISYVDPQFKNPRVSNLTVGVEQGFGHWKIGATYAYSHSWRLRTGGFSTTIWSRNVLRPTVSCTAAGQTDCLDQFGRAILQINPATGFGPTPQDPTIGQANELGSFGHGNYHEFVASVKRSFAQRFQLFSSYTLSYNSDNGSSERDTDTFFGPQDPFNLNLDYGRSGLDIRHQFKSAIVVDLPWHFVVSDSIQARSGTAYPAYDTVDVNNDGVSNQGFGSNDRPTVTTPGKSFLLPRYPTRQPGYFATDLRISKEFRFHEHYGVEAMVDLFNLTNRGNLYSNPDNSAFVPDQLTATPKQGDIFSGTVFGKRDQISPGSTPFAAQFGLRFNF
ncbi:MAG TPA: carboxypeptidase regulatory-like domain-containing protein [Terriglobales bacterium]|nr:carboxypeptidase regulatory-like domain-containing protein [Terriglobales bacterium]